MPKDFKPDSEQVAADLEHIINRNNVALLAFAFITSESSLEYFRDINQEDVEHSLKSLFEELRSIYELLLEENEELRDYKFKLKKELTQNV